MPHCWKAPEVTGIRGGGMSPYSTPPQRKMSPKSWSTPHQNWQSRKQQASPNDWSPQYYKPCSSPNGYWGPQCHWSNRWDPAPDYHRSWGSTPRTPTYSPYYIQSPQHGSVYPKRKTQGHFRRNHKDISHYYSPSMVEDPWAELKAEATKSAGPSLQQFSENKTPLKGN